MILQHAVAAVAETEALVVAAAQVAIQDAIQTPNALAESAIVVAVVTNTQVAAPAASVDAPAASVAEPAAAAPGVAAAAVAEQVAVATAAATVGRAADAARTARTARAVSVCVRRSMRRHRVRLAAPTVVPAAAFAVCSARSLRVLLQQQRLRLLPLR